VASVASNSITPIIAAPGIPAKLDVVPGNNSNSLTWSAPATGGTVANYIVQFRTSVNIPTVWTTAATLPGTSLSYTHTSSAEHIIIGSEGSGSNAARVYYYRVIAENTTGQSSPTAIATAFPIIGGTVLVHDSFNSAPSTPVWQTIPANSLPTSVAGIGSGGLSFLDAPYTELMYGQADGQWKINRAPAPVASTGLRAQTVHTIDRTLGANGTVVQYSYSVNIDGHQGWAHRFGFVDAAGRTISFYLNNPATGITNSGIDGSWADLGVPITTGVSNDVAEKNIGLPTDNVMGTNVGHIRFVFPVSGGLKVVASNGSTWTWTNAELPASFNNLKFFYIASGAGVDKVQKMDNFTITQY
jgi:hypothetical protein